MAKRGTLEHPKTLDLAGRLGIMPPFALGILEAFWAWVGKYYASGDVTNVRPALMADSIRYAGDAAGLWQNLQDAHLIDRTQDGRLLVHDWSEHADEGVNAVLARRQERFADGHIPSSGWLNKSERERYNQWLASMKQTDGGGTDGKPQQSADLPTGPGQVRPSTAIPEIETLASGERSPADDPAEAASQPNPKLVLIPPTTRKRCPGVDQRFTPFRDAIERHWNTANPGVEMPWDGSEAKTLNNFLKACPRTDLAAMERMLANRRASEVVQSHRPRTWIASLSDYANGPLDRFGKPARTGPHPEAAIGGASQATRDPHDAALEAVSFVESPTAEEWAAAAMRVWKGSPLSMAKLVERAQGWVEARQRVDSRGKLDRDLRYGKALEAVCAAGKATAILLQSKLRIGYAEAVFYLDRMEREGVISAPDPANGGARKIITAPVQNAQLSSMEASC